MDAINFFINNFLSDSSTSSSEDDEENNTRSGRRTRINNFEDVIDSYSDDEFRRDFRVTRSTFSYILSMIGNQIENGYGNFPAIILQAVCDHTMKFTHCYAGEVGSVHDAKVLRNSDLWSYMTTGAEEKFPNNMHLLGDKAYPLCQTLLIPYKTYGQLNTQQRNFNYKLSAARSVIERAFAILQGRWRCLKFLDVRTIEWISKYIVACCVLHNLCIINGDMFDQNEEDASAVLEYDDVHNETRREQGERRMFGIQKRDRIANELYNLL